MTLLFKKYFVNPRGIKIIDSYSPTQKGALVNCYLPSGVQILILAPPAPQNYMRARSLFTSYEHTIMNWVVDPLKPTPLKMNIKRARPQGAVAFFCCRKIITTRGLCDTLLLSTGRINYSGSIHFACMSRCSLTFVYISHSVKKIYAQGRGNSSLFFPHSSVAVSHSKLQTRGLRFISIGRQPCFVNVFSLIVLAHVSFD